MKRGRLIVGIDDVGDPARAEDIQRPRVLARARRPTLAGDRAVRCPQLRVLARQVIAEAGLPMRTNQRGPDMPAAGPGRGVRAGPVATLPALPSCRPASSVAGPAWPRAHQATARVSSSTRSHCAATYGLPKVPTARRVRQPGRRPTVSDDPWAGATASHTRC